MHHHLNRGKSHELHGFADLLLAEDTATHAAIARFDTVERMQLSWGIWEVLGSATTPAALGLLLWRFLLVGPAPFAGSFLGENVPIHSQDLALYAHLEQRRNIGELDPCKKQLQVDRQSQSL